MHASDSPTQDSFNRVKPQGRGYGYTDRLWNELDLCITVTGDLEEFLHIFFWLQIGLCVVGIVGSAIAAAVCWASKPRTSSCVQLAFLAVYDAVFLLTRLLVVVCNLTDSRRSTPAKIFRTLQSLTQWGVSYTTLDICAERFLSIAFPFFAHRRLTVGLAWKRSGVILVTGVLFVIPQILDNIFDYSVGNGCETADLQRVNVFDLTYTLYISLCLLYLLPFAAIISVNIAFAVLLCRLRGRSVRPSGENSTAEKQLSALVLGLSGWYSVSMLAPCLLFLIRLTRIELFHPATDLRVAAVADAVIVLSCCSNFLFYFLLWRPFRKLVCDWLRLKAGSFQSWSNNSHSYTPQTSSYRDSSDGEVGGTPLTDTTQLSARARGITSLS